MADSAVIAMEYSKLGEILSDSGQWRQWPKLLTRRSPKTSVGRNTVGWLSALKQPSQLRARLSDFHSTMLTLTGASFRRHRHHRLDHPGRRDLDHRDRQVHPGHGHDR